MVSIKRKLIYRFRIHNKEELKIIRESTLLKRRRFGISTQLGEWTEFKNLEEFDYWITQSPKKLGDCDIMIRVYFTNLHNLYQFQKKLKKLIPEWICGNHKCEDFECRYHMNCTTKFAIESENIEWTWRCILADEEDHRLRRTD